MRALPSQYLPALCGCDYVREGGLKKTRTESGWNYWAKQQAKKYSKRDGFTWYGVVAWIDFRQCYRISFAGQPEK